MPKILVGQFQLLLTDWDMPGMDGRTLCRRVREANLPTYLYVLLLTSHGSTDDVVAGSTRAPMTICANRRTPPSCSPA